MATALTDATSITVFGFKCWDEGTVENIGRSRSSATRTLVCKWSDRVALTTALRAGSSTIGSVSVYSAGAAYGDWALFCDSVQAVGVAGNDCLSVGPSGFVAYKYARLTVTYTSLEYGFADTSYSPDTVGIDYGVEVIHSRQSKPWLKFADDGTDVPAEDNPPFICPVLCFSVPLRNLPKLPRVELLAASAAPVNTALCLGVPSGKLMFDGGKAVHRLSAGRIAWDLDLSFKARMALDWNSVWTETGIRAIKRKGDSKPMFDTYDLNRLLPLGAAGLNALLAAEPPSILNDFGGIGPAALNTGI